MILYYGVSVPGAVYSTWVHHVAGYRPQRKSASSLLLPLCSTLLGSSVNEKKVRWRLKWGVSRIIADADVTPIVLPIYHIGLDTISPIKTPNWLRVGKTVTIVIGEPIDYTNEVTRMKECQMSS
ncbi:hypothetical protein DPMN_121907, partial [Dreissena polymorpha]